MSFAAKGKKQRKEIISTNPRQTSTPHCPTKTIAKNDHQSLKARIEFKICLITFKALKFNQPSYIRELLSFSSRESTLGLRSADDPYCLHELRATGERRFANRSFSYIALRLYNKLPITIKQIGSLNTFKSLLKAFLFFLCLRSVRSYCSGGLCIVNFGVSAYCFLFSFFLALVNFGSLK